MPLLEIKNLHAEVDGRKILQGLDLTVEKGSVHAIMGPNGSGKSTLAHVLAGKAGYEVTEGQVLLDGEDLLAIEPDERAARGLFLAFQYPLEIPGVATFTFLRTAINAQRKKRGEPELPIPEFMKRVREAAEHLDIDQDMLKRGVNVGFSGGEKKRNEVLQMALLEPRLCVLDETDFGPRHRCAQGGRRGRQPAALAGARLRRHHALSAPARPHRAGHRACALARTHRAHRRQGAGARAGGERLRAVPGGDGVTVQAAVPIRTAAEEQLTSGWQDAKGRLPGVARLRQAAFERFAKRACRTGASKSGNTPICAR